MKPKVQSPIKLINNCGAMNGKYPAVSIYKEKVHIHRLLMMYKHKTKFPTNIHIHHKDGDKL